MQYGGLKNCRIFEVAVNKLGKSLPDSLSQLHYLQHFSTYRNKFSSKIPFGHGSAWRKLKFLWLDQNLRTG